MSAKDSVVRAEQSEVPPRAAVILTALILGAAVANMNLAVANVDVISQRPTEHDNMKHKGREGRESKIPKEAPKTGACPMHLSLSRLRYPP